MLEYTVIVGEQKTFCKFIDRVNAHIVRGWQPLGGVSITGGGEGSPGLTRLAQAMVREVEDDVSTN